MISVTLNIDAEGLAPTLKDVFGAMTAEQKSKLAADIALAYFSEDMRHKKQHTWQQDRTTADDFMRDLYGEVKKHVADRLLDDPKLREQIDSILASVKGQLPAFIQAAVTSFLAQQIGQQFQALADVQSQQFQVTEALRQLGKQP